MILDWLTGQARRMIKRIGPLRRTFYRLRALNGTKGQSDEAAILRRLVNEANGPKTFVEFGFHPTEFNCASLVEDHQGLLVDCNKQSVDDANLMLPSNVRAKHDFISLENLEIVQNAFPALGVLSIDIDGNDFWVLQSLIALEPSVISVEYNSTLGLKRLSTVYDRAFERSKKHPSGFYHGASLTAFAGLLSPRGYGLAAVSANGANAFFTRSGNLDPAENWKPNALRERMSGLSTDQQWQTISEMPFEQV